MLSPGNWRNRNKVSFVGAECGQLGNNSHITMQLNTWLTNANRVHIIYDITCSLGQRNHNHCGIAYFGHQNWALRKLLRACSSGQRGRLVIHIVVNNIERTCVPRWLDPCPMQSSHCLVSIITISNLLTELSQSSPIQ